MSDTQRWPVWDWPVRLIHWYFPLAIAAMWWTGEEGMMQWHSWVGYSLLVAGVTRILWGVVGSHHARFSNFLRKPSAVLAYLRGEPFTGVGHNPVGGWSTLLLLLLVVTQAGTGLFSNDDIAFEGPFAYWAGDWSSALSELHEVNWSILLTLIVIHVLAILYYRFAKQKNLVKPMIFGQAEDTFSEVAPRSPWLALAIMIVVSGFLYLAIMSAPVAPSYY